MTDPYPVANWIPLAAYAAAGLAYAAFFARRQAHLGRLATTILAAAALAHTFIIGMETMRTGHLPFTARAGAISSFVWLLALAYLYTELSTEERAMGVFIVPILVVLQLVPALSENVAGSESSILNNPLFGVHVSSLLFAYASFAIAFVLGITYVLLFKEIKTRHLGIFYSRLPSLQKLDVMNQRTVAVGWVFLTLGLLIGVIWATQARGLAAADPRMQAMTVLDPKIAVAFLCWLVYSFQLFARRAIGWAGWRSAYLSALGFLIVLLNFVPIGYYFTKSHRF